MSTLSGKHIVLGITGSIAAYKACTLIRLLVKAGAEVQVVITPSGKEFITPLTLSTLTSKPVISDFFSQRDGTWHSHVSLGLWADAMIVAPATASTIGKMVNGIADNMLITTYLSMKAPVFIAPAMDLDMYKHPTTQHNLDRLRDFGNHIIEAADGELASHLVGKGRMEEPETIFDTLQSYFCEKDGQTSVANDLEGRRILITAGPTHEKLDAVRFIGNYSSGKMGIALAEECAARGADVILVCGPTNLSTKHPRIHRIDVVSAQEMCNQATAAFPNMDAAILCAAVADFTPVSVAEEKIRREESGNLLLELKPTQDIAATLGKMKSKDQKLVGFALETDKEQEHALDKLHRKNLDFIVMNSLKDEGAGFACDTNKVTFFTAKGETIAHSLKNKRMVAKDIVDQLVKL